MLAAATRSTSDDDVAPHSIHPRTPVPPRHHPGHLAACSWRSRPTTESRGNALKLSSPRNPPQSNPFGHRVSADVPDCSGQPVVCAARSRAAASDPFAVACQNVEATPEANGRLSLRRLLPSPSRCSDDRVGPARVRDLCSVKTARRGHTCGARQGGSRRHPLSTQAAHCSHPQSPMILTGPSAAIREAFCRAAASAAAGFDTDRCPVGRPRMLRC